MPRIDKNTFITGAVLFVIKMKVGMLSANGKRNQWNHIIINQKSVQCVNIYPRTIAKASLLYAGFTLVEDEIIE